MIVRRIDHSSRSIHRPGFHTQRPQAAAKVSGDIANTGAAAATRHGGPTTSRRARWSPVPPAAMLQLWVVAVAMAAAAGTWSVEARSVMFAGDPPLEQGDSLVAFPIYPFTTFKYELRIQDDCNLVLLDRGAPVWATGTDVGKELPHGTCLAQLRRDGDFQVVRRKSGGGLKTLWTSGTAGVSPGADFRLEMQSDRNVVLYSSFGDKTAPRAVWASQTNVPQ